MGNALQYIEDLPSIALHYEVVSAGKLLTGCKLSSGTLTEIRKLFNKFNARRRMEFGYFMSLAQFKELCRNTPIETLEEQIFRLFSQNKARQMGFLELLSALVWFASTTWQHKVHFAMCIFDFDGNMCLSEDEFTIFIAAFLNGLGYTTETSMPKAASLSKVSKVIFNVADRNPDGLITLEE
jgi:Ca2+-binding EF-hand superfamily protein